MKWLRDKLVKNYSSVSYSEGKLHNYLDMTFDLGMSGECKVMTKRNTEELLLRRRTG